MIRCNFSTNCSPLNRSALAWGTNVQFASAHHHTTVSISSRGSIEGPESCIWIPQNIICFYLAQQMPLLKLRRGTGKIQQQIYTWMNFYRKSIMDINIHFLGGNTCHKIILPSLIFQAWCSKERYEIASK